MLARNKRIFNLNVKRLYINMHVCIYIYIYTHTHTHTHLCLSIHIYISSVIQSCPTLFDPMDCSTPGFLVHQQLLELAHVHELVMTSNHLILCRPLLLLSCLRSFLASGYFPMSQFFTSGGQ